MAQLYFYYSAMNAGKSTTLLQSAYNYRERGMEVEIFTAAIDDRFGSGIVRSRIGLETRAALFDDATRFRDPIGERVARGPLACVLIDEAQFLTAAQVDELARVVDELHVPVLCFGLRTDFLGEPFPGSGRLLAIADKLEELKTVCSCGRKATMNVRFDEAGRPLKAGEQVQIGDARYESMCRRHYREAMDSVGE